MQTARQSSAVTASLTAEPSGVYLALWGCPEAEGQSPAYCFPPLKLISHKENEIGQATTPGKHAEKAGQGQQPFKSRRGLASGGGCSFPTAKHTVEPVRLNAWLYRTPQARAPQPGSAPRGSRDAGRPQPPPAQTPILGASGARSASARADSRADREMR